MNATELHLADGRPAGIFFCQECRLVRRTRPEAENCCRPAVCACGATIAEKYWITCPECRRAKEAQKAADRFAKARKITPAEVEGMIYCDHLGINNGYFHSVDELLEECELEDLPAPPYAWACIGTPIFRSDIFDSILEHAYDEAYEEWAYDGAGAEDLQAAILRFVQANDEPGNYYWNPDFSTAILLDAPAP